MPGRITPPMPDSDCPAMGDQRIDQRAGRWPAAGCTTSPRLVDDDELIVLVEDVERDRLGLRLGGFGGGTLTASASPDLTR